MALSVNRTRPKIGLAVPHWEGISDARAPAPRWFEIQAMALAAEDAGVDPLWLCDHLEGLWEGWSPLAALAAVTQRVTLGHIVMCTSFRNPALLAKMADTVDEISGGRLILGLGAGYVEAEYRAFGYPFDHRVSRFEEALQIIHGLLRHGEIDFEGTYYTARECELRPRGPRRTGAPILIGSNSPRMLRLTARYADMWNGWLVVGRSTPDEVAPLRGAVDAACAAEGRDPASLVRTVAVRVSFPGPEPYLFNFKEAIGGSTEQIAATLWAFADAGVEHLILLMPAERHDTIDEIGRVIELMDRRH